jgi:NAD(P)-dependent dehydrogenase (short-subunit alcohol dehydrogenase family)
MAGTAVDVNFLSAVRLNAALLPQMLDLGSGAIVHIASSAARRVPAPLLHYGASNAALIAYSKRVAPMRTRSRGFEQLSGC